MDTEERKFEHLSQDYYIVESAIQFVDENYGDQPTLEDIAQHVNLSVYHFQRLFKRWVGISPKRFLQFITKEHAKRMLEARHGMLDVTYQTGLSSPGRLHDLFVTCEAVTPGEYRAAGEGLTIRYGIHPTPFGNSLISVTERGICGLVFLNKDATDVNPSAYFPQWKKAKFQFDMVATRSYIRQIFNVIDRKDEQPLPIYLHGTNFQIKVWEALMKIPAGQVVTYEEIAFQIGMPGASRAVGNAVARNSIPVIIPCHRVIRKTGVYGKYRYGSARKRAMLAWEFAGADAYMEA